MRRGVSHLGVARYNKRKSDESFPHNIPRDLTAALRRGNMMDYTSSFRSELLTLVIRCFLWDVLW